MSTDLVGTPSATALLQCVTVVTTVKLLNISSYIVLNMTDEKQQLTDTVESIWHEVKDDGFALDKLHFVVAPGSDDIVTRTKDLLYLLNLHRMIFDQHQQTEFYNSSGGSRGHGVMPPNHHR